MPSILDRPPDDVREELAALRDALDAQLPPKRLDRNVLIATWNLRSFADLTEKWTASDDDSPKRDLRSLLAIGEIIKRFDVCALQEVKGNLRALRHLLRWLGPNWGLILTDVSQGSSGNSERLAYLFDRRTVRLSGLAAEVVIPDDYTTDITPASFRGQFARSPYAVSFAAGNDTFILVTLHVVYGVDGRDRTEELRVIARWLADWASRVNAWDHNLIALGDFNIDRQDDPNYQAFTSTGLRPAPGLVNVPRSIFDDPSKPDTLKFYDQIAWFTGETGVPALSLTPGRAGSFDFAPCVQTHRSRQALSYRISDHYPLWAEFLLRAD
ncbi:MAG: endonuclease/exonuclease/phosphatase family protein [Alphaproteobacteria bacterium]|nr:endonuclease/exonuclease/phosphatase family protein [Alphaproteobacteria bacterium]